MVPRGGVEPPTLRFSEAVLVNEFNDLARPHSAKLALYNSGLQNRMTILFEPDGIVVKEDVASTTIHGPIVERLLAALRADPPLKPRNSAIEAARLALWCGKF